MEWNRIESKWNEMARRLQVITPALRSNSASGLIAGMTDSGPRAARDADTARAIDKVKITAQT